MSRPYLGSYARKLVSIDQDSLLCVMGVNCRDEAEMSDSQAKRRPNSRLDDTLRNVFLGREHDADAVRNSLVICLVCCQN